MIEIFWKHTWRVTRVVVGRCMRKDRGGVTTSIRPWLVIIDNLKNSARLSNRVISLNEITPTHLSQVFSEDSQVVALDPFSAQFLTGAFQACLYQFEFSDVTTFQTDKRYVHRKYPIDSTLHDTVFTDPVRSHSNKLTLRSSLICFSYLYFDLVIPKFKSFLPKLKKYVFNVNIILV